MAELSTGQLEFVKGMGLIKSVTVYAFDALLSLPEAVMMACLTRTLLDRDGCAIAGSQTNGARQTKRLVAMHLVESSATLLTLLIIHLVEMTSTTLSCEEKFREIVNVFTCSTIT